MKEDFKNYLNKAATGSEVYSFQNLKAIYEEWNGRSVSEATFRVTLHRMKKKGIINPVRRGWYTINSDKRLELITGEVEKKMYREIKSDLPLLNIAIWNSLIFDRFASFQSVKRFYFVEVESGSEESVFHILQELHPEDLFLKPNEEIYSNYITKTDNPVIIKTLISESPVESSDGIPHPSIEKIIVDLFADELSFRPWIGERDRIITEIFEITTINLSTLLRYASRRNRKESIKSFIIERDLVNTELLKGL